MDLDWGHCKRLTKLNTPAEYYSMLLFHVGINSAARGGLGSIEQALGLIAKSVGAQVGFSLILLVRRRVVRRTIRWVLLVNR